MDNRMIPTPEEAREELARRRDARENMDIPTPQEAKEELARRNSFSGQLQSSANSPAINFTLGMGDELANLLSLGYLNPKFSEGTAYNIGNVAGQVAPAMVAEPLVAGSKLLSAVQSPLLRRLIASGLTTGAQTALQTPGNRTEAGALGASAGAGMTGLSALASKLSPFLGLPIRAGLGGLAGYELGEQTGLGGGKGAAAGSLAGGLAPQLIPSIAKKLGEKAALSGVDLTAAKPRLEAAKRLGLEYLTPAEATGSPFVAANQGAIGRTGEGAQLMVERAHKRLQSEKEAINNLRNTIYDPTEMGPKKKALYKEAYTKNAPSEFIEQQKTRPLVAEAFKKVQSDPAYQEELGINPKETVTFYHGKNKESADRILKEGLRAPEYSENYALLTNKPTAASAYSARRMPEQDEPGSLLQIKIPRSKLYEYIQPENKNWAAQNLKPRGEEDAQIFGIKKIIPPKYIKGHSDEYLSESPENINLGIPENNYAYLDQVNRALGDMRTSALKAGANNRARIIKKTQKDFINPLDQLNPEFKKARQIAEREITLRDKINKKLNEQEMIGTNFYNKILKNDDNFKKLKNSVRNVQGAAERLDDMRLVFKDLINPRTVKTAFGQTEHGMKQNRNAIDAAKDLVNQLNGKRYDKAFIELISNPHWDREFNRVMNLQNKSEKIVDLTNLLNRASSYTISEALKKKEENEE